MPGRFRRGRGRRSGLHPFAVADAMLKMTMQYFLRRALRTHAGRTAVVDGSRTFSYADLDRASDAIADYLLRQGLVSGERVAVLLANSAEFIESELGIVKAGLMKIPINNKLSTLEVVEILRDSAATAIVLDGEFQDGILAHREALPALRLLLSPDPRHEEVIDLAAVKSATPADTSCWEAAADDPCSMRYSGGTTGRPKGIVHSHAGCVEIALAVIREYALHAGDVFLHVGHLSHGQNFVWPAFLAQGAKLVMLRRFDPLQVLEHVEQHKVTRLHLVPTMINAVFNHPDLEAYDLSSVTAVVYASAPMATEHIRRLYDKVGPRIRQTYTLSESAVITTALRPEDHVPNGTAEQVARLASCGREVLEVELRIVDSSLRELPTGEVGEIVIRSPGNMMGYWNQPELTAQVLRDGWVLTGDLGCKDADGYVFLIDRKDDKIITGGFNVYPREVEDVLYRHPAVREAAVFGIPDPLWGEAITAVVALHAGTRCDESELIEYCAARMSSYKKPKSVIIRDDLPKSAVGKILRRAVRDPFWEGMTRQVN